MEQRLKQAPTAQRRIGLTGGIASGKSTVGRLLMGRFGLPVLDADRYAREALEPGTPVSRAVLNRYGDRILQQKPAGAPPQEPTAPPGGDECSIDRAALGRIIFADAAERRWLEQQIHPRVRERFTQALGRLANEPVVVLMIPLLFEAGLEGLCTETWVVSCGPREQRRRLMARDGLTAEEADARLRAQWPLARKRELADVVIDNPPLPNGGSESLLVQLRAALGRSPSPDLQASPSQTGRQDGSDHRCSVVPPPSSPASPEASWTPIPGGVSAPVGFRAAGVTAGLKPSGRPDLSLVLAPPGAACAGSFTTNHVRAACVDLCAGRLRASGGRARAILTNSGQANACTGDRGLADSLTATEELAARLGLRPEEVLICSTGVIGVPIPMEILLAGLDPLVAALEPGGGAAAAQAILTTDLVDKQMALEADLGGRRVRLGGMAKGSGMIHPAMATMLATLTCDAGVPPEPWREMVARAVERSFNAITVDGDTSTNDCLLAMAAGEALPAEHWQALENGITRLAQFLARAVARDGEGATCLIEVTVEGTAGEDEARRVARTIVGSSLVKTAIHGRDPNWGRIVAAAGRAGVVFDPAAVALWLGQHQLMQAGQPLAFDRPAASLYLRGRAEGAYLEDDTVSIRLRVGNGPGRATAWGCDLSDQYVRINADYTT